MDILSTKNGGIDYDLFWQERKINLEKFLNSLNSVIYLLWNDTEEFLLNVLFSVWNSEKVDLLFPFLLKIRKRREGGGVSYPWSSGKHDADYLKIERTSKRNSHS